MNRRVILFPCNRLSNDIWELSRVKELTDVVWTEGQDRVRGLKRLLAESAAEGFRTHSGCNG